MLSRRRLYPDVARRRFGAESRGLRGKGVDLSERVDGGRRGYRVRRRRSREGSEVGTEGLEARIARLRREVEEVRLAAQHEEGEGEGDGKGDEVGELGRLLAEVPVQKRQGGRGESAVLHAEREDEGSEQTLQKVTDFDSRLTSLEQTLGTTSLFDTSNPNALSTPILPTLTLLDNQLAALSTSTSLSNLETASARLSKLRAETSTSRPTSSSSTSDPAEISSDDLIKLQNLYTLLPTLQSLAPTVPALLTRLHSLRTLHAGAANAASELEDVETRQVEMEAELKAWREGLEKVEQAVGEASEANGRNGKVVEAWVRELEGRVMGLGR